MPRYTEDNIFDEIPSELYNLKENYQLILDEKLFIFNAMHEQRIPICRYTVNKLYKAYHLAARNNDFETANNIFTDYLTNYWNNFKTPMKPADEDIQRNQSILEELFQRDKRFHGRIPNIVNHIAFVYTMFEKTKTQDFSHKDFVDRFNLRAAKYMRDTNIPENDRVLFYLTFTPDECISLADNPNIAFYTADLLYDAYFKDNKKALKTASWIVNHIETNDSLIHKLCKNYDDIDLQDTTTVDGLKAELDKLDSLPEIKRLEKRYKKPGFKFKNVVCELKDVNVQTVDDKYTAYIMDATDVRQVTLGQSTFCCQKLDDAGESAMMHGLLNPKAGFFIIEDKRTKEIKAQAEIWEDNENTLVFDNIEFANDADISVYTSILAKYLQNSSYKTVIMGAGYNGLTQYANFQSAGPRKPSVTPYEVYVISYEEGSEAPIFESEEEARKALESGEVTYFDYVYCDSENESYYMKKDGIVCKELLTNKDVYVNSLLAYVSDSLPLQMRKDIIDCNSNIIYYNPEYNISSIMSLIDKTTNHFEKECSLSDFEDALDNYLNNISTDDYETIPSNLVSEFRSAFLSAVSYYLNHDHIMLFGVTDYSLYERDHNNLDYDDEDYDDDYDEDDEDYDENYD